MLYCSGCLLFRVRESSQEIRTESSGNLEKSGLDAEEPQKNRNESNSTGFYFSFLLIGGRKAGNNLENLHLMICLIPPLHSVTCLCFVYFNQLIFVSFFRIIIMDKILSRRTD